MTNFEYLIYCLENNEELVEQINSLDTDLIPVIANEVVCGGFDDFVEQQEYNSNLVQVQPDYNLAINVNRRE